MHLSPKSSSRSPLHSPFFLFLIVGNLLFSAIFVMSMGMQVAKTNNHPQEQAETKPAPQEEQKLVTLAQIN